MAVVLLCTSWLMLYVDALVQSILRAIMSSVSGRLMASVLLKNRACARLLEKGFLSGVEIPREYVITIGALFLIQTSVFNQHYRLAAWALFR